MGSICHERPKSEDVVSRDAGDDPVQARLCLALEVPTEGRLWGQADAIVFVPYVLPVIYGDGRTLFWIQTMNQVPAYWVIRGCSTWRVDGDCVWSAGINFAQMLDRIFLDLETAFGTMRCDYSGNNLGNPLEERLQECQCEDCSDPDLYAEWPMVDDYGGSSWGRMEWPGGFATAENPLDYRFPLLSAEESAKWQEQPEEET